jgi:hypothetical protein
MLSKEQNEIINYHCEMALISKKKGNGFADQRSHYALSD